MESLIKNRGLPLAVIQQEELNKKKLWRSEGQQRQQY
jgi:hypothetical protein